MSFIKRLIYFIFPISLLFGASQDIAAYRHSEIDGFLVNNGQWADSVHALCRCENMDIWVVDSGLLLIQYIDDTQGRSPEQNKSLTPQPDNHCRITRMRYFEPNEADSAKKIIVPQYGNIEQSKINIIKGSNPDNWINNISVSQNLSHFHVWPGIDVLYSIDNGVVRAQIKAKPGSDLSNVMFKVDVISGTNDNATTSSGFFSKYISGQSVGNLKKSNQLFEIHEADPGVFELVLALKIGTVAETIDALFFSTYIGASNYDYPWNIGLAQNGDPVISGYTKSLNFPITGDVYSPEYKGGARDAFVARFDRVTGALIFSTFLGGSSDDYCYDMAITSSDDIYLCGKTYSTNFPATSGAHQTGNLGHADVFVSKLSGDGKNLIWSSYLGGNGDDYAFGLGLNQADCPIVCGWAQSGTFPTTPNALGYNSYGWSRDVFISCFDAHQGSLKYSAILRAGSSDIANDIVIDSLNNTWIVGTTSSADFPVTENAYNRTINGSDDIFLMKIDSLGEKILASTFIGGYSSDKGISLCINEDQLPIITGITESPDFPVSSSAYCKNYHDGQDVIVSGFNSNLEQMIFSTYFGWNEKDYVNQIQACPDGKFIILGTTWSKYFPITDNAYQSGYGGNADIFVTQFSKNGEHILYSTFMGGSELEFGVSCIWEDPGIIFFTGYSESYNYPVNNGAWDRSFNGGRDGIVTGLRLPYLQLRQPDTLLQWPAGSVVNISWDSFGIDQIEILIVDTSSAEPVEIVDLLDGNAGVYSWMIPQEMKGIYRIIIQSSQDSLFRAEQLVQIVDSDLSIDGHINYWESSSPIPDVSLGLTGNHDYITYTDADGYYLFGGVFQNSDYLLSPEKKQGEDLQAQVISAYDAALTARHVIGKEQYDGYPALASDIDENGAIEMNDVVSIARYTVGLSPVMSGSVGGWRFDPGVRNFVTLDHDYTDINFQGYCLGDVSGNWTDGQTEKLSAAGAGLQAVSEKDTLCITLMIEDGVKFIGLDLWLQYSSQVMDFISVQSEDTSDLQIYFNVVNDSGLIKVAAISTEKVEGPKNILNFIFVIKDHDASINIACTRFSLDEVPYSCDDISLLSSVGDNEKSVKPAGISCYPNPFNREITIRIDILGKQKSELIITDIKGRIVRQLLHRDLQAGTHLVYWDGVDEAGQPVSSGVYFARYISDKGSLCVKLIKIH